MKNQEKITILTLKKQKNKQIKLKKKARTNLTTKYL